MEKIKKLKNKITVTDLNRFHLEAKRLEFSQRYFLQSTAQFHNCE